MIRFGWRGLVASVAIVGALTFLIAEADAAAGRGSSSGSRGSRTYSAPPPTATTPNAARPMERSVTQPGATANAGRAATAPAAGGMFGRPGFLGGLAAGFLGAGLLGMLFGGGLAGGMGGAASIIGLLLQIVLFGGIAYFIWTWWQRRQQGQSAYAAPRGMNRDVAGYEPSQGSPTQNSPMAMQSSSPLAGLGLGGLGGGGQPQGGGYGYGNQQKGPSDEIGIKPTDYDAFEQLLKDVQLSYGREDLNALRGLSTPEMLSYFSQDLADNTSRGVVNHVSAPKLLQGDLAEAWREGNTEYATVAMRYELTETFVDRQSGRVVEGDASKPIELTEMWTFMRSQGGKWILSAIQQPN